VLAPRGEDGSDAGAARARRHNVGRLLVALDRILPPGCAFAPEDLEAAPCEGGRTPRPERVVDCVLFLRAAAKGASDARACASPLSPRRAAQQQGRAPSPPGGAPEPGSGGSSPSAGRSAGASASAASEPATPVQQAGGTPGHFGSCGGVRASACGAIRAAHERAAAAAAGGGDVPLAAEDSTVSSSSTDPFRPLARGLHSRAGVAESQQLAHTARQHTPPPPAAQQQHHHLHHSQQLAHHLTPPQQHGLAAGHPASQGPGASPAMLAASMAGGGLTPPGGLPMAAALLPVGLPAPMASMSALAGMATAGAAMQRAGDMRSMQAVAGVTRLMQQCSSMLRERMYIGGGTPQQLARSPAPFDPQEVGAAAGRGRRLGPCRVVRVRGRRMEVCLQA
jgi:hypothetical protein